MPACPPLPGACLPASHPPTCGKATHKLGAQASQTLGHLRPQQSQQQQTLEAGRLRAHQQPHHGRVSCCPLVQQGQAVMPEPRRLHLLLQLPRRGPPQCCAAPGIAQHAQQAQCNVRGQSRQRCRSLRGEAPPLPPVRPMAAGRWR